MTRQLCTLFPLVFVVACKATDDTVQPKHETCKSLDDRGIINRLDNVRTRDEDQNLFALNGHCLEALRPVMTASVWGVRFIPETDEGETPDFHIQLYFIPPDESGEMVVTAPERLSRAECVMVPEGELCGHVDDNTNDDADDDVDLRGKSGVLAFEIVDSDGEGTHRYEGELEWALFGINTTDSREVYRQPSIKMWADFHWAHPDGSW